MENANTIEAAFEEFNARVVKRPNSDNARAINDCRLIFFAGAIAFWRALENGAVPDALVDELSDFIGKTIERVSGKA